MRVEIIVAGFPEHHGCPFEEYRVLQPIMYLSEVLLSFFNHQLVDTVVPRYTTPRKALRFPPLAVVGYPQSPMFM